MEASIDSEKCGPYSTVEIPTVVLSMIAGDEDDSNKDEDSNEDDDSNKDEDEDDSNKDEDEEI